MEEFFTIAGPKDPEELESEIVVHGCVTRNLAHGPARVPHASVQIIPVRCGTGNLLLHKRSEKPRTSPGMWDFFGGHVSLEMGILLSPNGLEDASEETALREAREELLVTVQSKPHLILKSHFQRIGRVGEFRWGMDDLTEQNVEYSTAYALCIPEHADVVSPFELREGGVDWLRIEDVSWDDVMELYQWIKSTPPPCSLPDKFKRFTDTQGEFKGKFRGFADGAARILEKVLMPSNTRQEVEESLSWCQKQTIPFIYETALISEQALAEDWNRPEEDAAWSHLQRARDSLMSSTGQTVEVTLRLPKNMYERVTQAALMEQRQVEDLLGALIAEGLEAHMTRRELLEHVSEDYRARLAREGKLSQSSDDVLQELRDLREQIARDLYPE